MERELVATAYADLEAGYLQVVLRSGVLPDFMVKIQGRSEAEGIALAEVKGPLLQLYERAKAAARHPTYGRVFMVGKDGAEGGFRMWRLAEGDTLVNDGPFEISRLMFS